MRLVLATREPAKHSLPDLTELVSWGASPRATLGLVAMGWFSSMFVLTLVRDGVLLLAWLTQVLGGVSSVDLPRIRQWSAVAVPLLALAGSLVGFFNARRTARDLKRLAQTEDVRGGAHRRMLAVGRTPRRLPLPAR